jgi:hypothetical protein
MMADLVAAVSKALAAQGLLVEVRDGAEVPAQELEGTDPATGLPIPRIVFIENGYAGNLPDRYDGPTGAIALPGLSAAARHLYLGFLTRTQAVEVRVWGFDTTADASGNNIATPPQHRAAVNRLLHNSDTTAEGLGTGLLPALYSLMGMANITWLPQRGHFDNDQKDVKFGALYIFEMGLPIPVIARRVAVATPSPAVALQGS